MEQDFYDLANVLSDIQGRFLMTINDTPPDVPEIFKRFTIEEIELKYLLNRVEKSRSQVRTEHLVGNGYK